MLEAHYDVIIIPLLFPEKFTVGVDAVLGTSINGARGQVPYPIYNR
jgi:hypothetical protein